MASRPMWDAAVLCGGASRRMGRDKAHLPVDGLPMYKRVLAAATAAEAAAVFVIGGDPGRFEAEETFVPDRWPGEGPFGGVVTALTTAGTSPVVAVLSCDLLHPDADTIGRVIDARSDADSDVAVPVVDGREQWTHAVWHRRVAGLLEARFDAGTRAVHAAVDGLTVARPQVSASGVADADRPEDLP